MIKLNQTASQYLQLITGQNGAVVDVSYSDKSSADFLGDSQLTSIVTATTTTICDTPAASVVRYIDFISITNTFAGNHTITVQQNSSATAYPIVKDLVMSSGDRLEYTHACGWRVVDSNGAIHTVVASPQVVIAAGKTLTVSNSMTLSSTDGATINLADASLFPTVASATSPDIFGAAGATINYTGTTTATSFVACTTAQIGSTKTLIPVTGASFTASANLIIDGTTSGTVLQPAGAIIHITPVTTTQFKMTTILAYGSWTPTVTAQAGTFTTVSATGTYHKTGRMITFFTTVTITDNGTAATAVIVTIPTGFTIVTNGYGVGRENAVTGNLLLARTSVTGVITLSKYDGTYPGATGYVLISEVSCLV